MVSLIRCNHRDWNLMLLWIFMATYIPMDYRFRDKHHWLYTILTNCCMEGNLYCQVLFGKKLNLAVDLDAYKFWLAINMNGWRSSNAQCQQPWRICLSPNIVILCNMLVFVAIFIDLTCEDSPKYIMSTCNVRCPQLWTSIHGV